MRNEKQEALEIAELNVIAAELNLGWAHNVSSKDALRFQAEYVMAKQRLVAAELALESATIQEVYELDMAVAS